jgi:hypothetical protein
MTDADEIANRADAQRLARTEALQRYHTTAARIRFEAEKMTEAKTAHEMEVSLNYLMSYYTQAMAAFKDFQAAHQYLEDRGQR